MTFNNNSKHVFPGSNTPFGFYPYYDNIISQESANKIFIIKGGPGTGKSSFMKKVAGFFIDKNVEVEFHHCSADPSSLDGIVIVPAKVAIIDGTSPHVMDPLNPGAVDEILNFSPYWDEQGIRANKESIMAINLVRKQLFNKAYYYLNAAKSVYDAYAQAQAMALNNIKLSTIEQDILKSIFENCKPSNQLGKSRHLFGSAITPDGFIDYLHTIIDKSQIIYTIKDSPGASAKNLMNNILSKGVDLGLYMECYHSPIDREKIEDIVIPKLGIGITVLNDYHTTIVDTTNVYNLTACLDSNTLSDIQSDLDLDYNLINELFARGISTLKQAKTKHALLESYYIPHVNFDKINNLTQDIIAQISHFF